MNYQGVPYYMKQMNEWVRTFAQHVNDILGTGYDAYGAPGNPLFAADMATDDKQYDFSNEDFRYDLPLADGTSKVVDLSDPSYYWMTADNFNIFDAMIKDADLLATRKEETNGSDDYSVLTDLKNMFTDKSMMSFRGCNAGEFLQCILADVALNANRANTFCTNYENIAKSIDTQRLSISGVDEDEEATNLVRFQNGYSLMTKMIQTLTEVYDKLILDTGV